MVGQAGFICHDGRKVHHKGQIWGVYVTAAARGQGVATAMLTQLLDRVRSYSDLEQVTLSGRVRSHHLMLQTWIDILSRYRHTCTLGPSTA